MINDILKKTELHLTRAKSTLKEIKSWDNINTDVFENTEKIKTVDAFIYRFVKLQDYMGSKLFRAFLDRVGELQEDMSLLDVLDKLEKLKIIKSSKEWMELRKIRNQLTHEYPDNEEEIIEGIKLAIKSFNDVEEVFDRISERIDKINYARP